MFRVFSHIFIPRVFRRSVPVHAEKYLSEKLPGGLLPQGLLKNVGGGAALRHQAIHIRSGNAPLFRLGSPVQRRGGGAQLQVALGTLPEEGDEPFVVGGLTAFIGRGCQQVVIPGGGGQGTSDAYFSPSARLAKAPTWAR